MKKACTVMLDTEVLRKARGFVLHNPSFTLSSFVDYVVDSYLKEHFSETQHKEYKLHRGRKLHHDTE